MCGSPAVSPDGKQLAFDGRSIKPRTSSTMFVMSIDGSEPKQLRSGMMPNWSKDGKSLTFSTGGVRIMKLDGTTYLDGTAEKIFAKSGWGAQWSPDGKRIAFYEGTAIKTYDVAAGTIDTVLEGNEHAYRQFYWNMTWSPDSTRLCCKATKPDGTNEIVTLNMIGEKPKLKVHHSTKLGLNGDFAWHPRGDRIVFSGTCPERRGAQLYEFNPDQDAPPKLVVGQDPTRNNTDLCWTPDGKRLIVVSGDF